MKNVFLLTSALFLLLLSFSATSCDKGEDEETTDAVVIESL